METLDRGRVTANHKRYPSSSAHSSVLRSSKQDHDVKMNLASCRPSSLQNQIAKYTQSCSQHIDGLAVLSSGSKGGEAVWCQMPLKSKKESGLDWERCSRGRCSRRSTGWLFPTFRDEVATVVAIEHTQLIDDESHQQLFFIINL